MMYIMIDLQDNVFVNVVASVQYRALADKASDAFYKLSNTREQIQSYVFDGKMPYVLNCSLQFHCTNKCTHSLCPLILPWYLPEHC